MVQFKFWQEREMTSSRGAREDAENYGEIKTLPADRGADHASAGTSIGFAEGRWAKLLPICLLTLSFNLPIDYYLSP